MYRVLVWAALLLFGAVLGDALLREVPAAAALVSEHGPLLLPLAALAAMLGLWWSRGRDPKPLAVPAWYDPPEGLAPGPMGALLDDRADLREVAATLADLTVRGFLRIETERGEHVLVAEAARLNDWHRLPEYEGRLLRCLFRGGRDPRVPIADTREHFHRHYEELREAIWGELVARGYYAAHPGQVKTLYVACGILLSAGAVMLSAGMAASEAALVAAWLTGVPVVAIGWFMPMRTARGTHALRLVLGFREFLERVESDRFRRMIRSPDEFERYLPYAIALGLDERWKAAFDDVYSLAHDLDRRMGWYWLGSDPRQPTSFRDTLLGLLAAAR